MRRRHTLALLSLVPFALTVACGDDGGSSSAPETPAAEPRVEVGLVHHPAPSPAGAPDLGGAGEARVFENAFGQTLRLETGRYTVSSVTLLHCAHEDEAARRALDVSPRDHATDGDGQVLLFAGTDDIVATADWIAQTKTFAVEPERYCGLTMLLAPVEDEPTFRFAATCTAADDPAASRFFDATYRGAIEKTIDLHRLDDAGSQVELELDPTSDVLARPEDGDSVSDVLIGLSYDELFRSVDCMDLSDEDITAALAAGLAGSTIQHQHLGRLDGFAGL